MEGSLDIGKIQTARGNNLVSMVDELINPVTLHMGCGPGESYLLASDAYQILQISITSRKGILGSLAL